MLVSFFCPLCRSKLEIETDAAGTEVLCPQCGESVTVPRKPLGPGITVGGFKIKKLIGRGAMGEVYLARQLSTERDVALKILPGRLTMDKDLVERFLKEVRTQAKMEHSNIVPVHEAGEDSGVYFMAMAYVGEALADRLRRLGPMPEREALEMIHKLAGALAYAWDEHRLLHRDIKPSNILLDQHGNPRISDLGLSKSLKEAAGTTLTDVVVGTPNYMSPEQAEGNVEIDFRSDIYSMGATLYHMLTGQVPYEGNSVVDILRKQATELLPDPRDFNDKISDACVELMALMLAKDRELRHPSWNALMGDIERVLAGEHPRKEALAPGESAILRVRALGADKEEHKRIHLRPSEVVRLHDHGLSRSLESEKRKGPRLVGAVLLVLAALGAAVLLRVWRQRAAEEPAAAPPEEVAAAEALPDAAQTAFQKRYDEAVRYAREHPEDYAGAIKWFEDLARDGKGTEYEIRATAEVKRLKQARKEAMDAVLAELRSQGEQLLSEGKGEEAVATVLGYTGPLAEDTRNQREYLAEELGQKAEALRRVEEEKQTAAQSAWASLLSRVAEDLLKGDFEAAVAGVDHAQSEASLTASAGDVAALADLVRKVASMEDVILDSFRKDQDRQVAIDFRNGSQVLEIVSVGTKRVKGRRKLDTSGYVQRMFYVKDLSLQEQYERLGAGTSPEVEIMRGVLLYQAQKPSAAEQFFRRAGVPLGDELAGRTARLMADAREGMAATALAGVLRVAGLPADVEVDEERLRGIRRTAYSPGDVVRIRDAVAKFRQAHGGTRKAEEAEPLLKALERVGTAPRDIDPAVLDKAIQRVKDANLQVATLLHVYDINDEGIELDLSKNAGLTDITALRGLPLTKLNLDDTGVGDLEALRGMPLQHLEAMNCPIEDIDALEGMPLRVLNLSGCSVRNIRPLKGLPLEVLNLAGNRVDMITTLSDMRLTSLDIAACPVLDIRPLRGMPLEFLTVMKTRVADLKALKGLPLKYLNMAATAVGDLGDLEGLPLEVLIISGTPVTDLSPLKGMPLRELYADHCRRLSNLWPLEGLPLTALGINVTSVEDLRPLKGMSLTSLTMAHTPILDLAPLKGMSTLMQVRWDVWDHYTFMRPARYALRDGNYGAAKRWVQDLVATIDGIPAFVPVVMRLRALLDEFMPQWAGPQKDQPRAWARTFGGHAYALGPVMPGVGAARDYCAAHGAHLATITSPQEMKWVTDQFGLFGMPVLLGGTDEKKEGTWQWMNGEPWGFTNWPPQQPDNFKGAEHNLVFMMGGAWHDVGGDCTGPCLMEWEK